MLLKANFSDNSVHGNDILLKEETPIPSIIPSTMPHMIPSGIPSVVEEPR